MDRVPVDSSAAKSVGYESETHTLEVEYTSGGVYRYFWVPEAVYDALRFADSVGKFINAHIKEHYPHQRVA
jgi:hypothetical protein